MTSQFIKFHDLAAAEFETALDWYLMRNRLAATKFVDEVDRALDLITRNPQRWPKHIHGTRRFLLRHFPFAIVYRSSPPTVQVIAVAHGRRRPDYWKERL